MKEILKMVNMMELDYIKIKIIYIKGGLSPEKKMEKEN
jgi:hypothetical protein